jgi:hypothetical protein
MVAHADAGSARSGPLVRFRIRDAFHPEPIGVLEGLDVDAELVGRLIELSDSGDRRDAFGVVELVGGSIVVVPVTALTPVRDA